MKLKIICWLIIILFIIPEVWGFDGIRQGFVLGGGPGMAPVATWSAKGIKRTDETGNPLPDIDIDENKAGPALNLIIGYAWDNNDMIIYEGNVCSYESDFWSNSLMGQGFNGIAWYHYYGPSGKSAFTALGLGFYVCDIDELDYRDPGYGVLLGGGYEFARHWQVGLYFSFGQTTEYLIGDFNHSHLDILVSTVAF